MLVRVLKTNRWIAVLVILLCIPLLTATSQGSRAALLEPETPNDTFVVFVPNVYAGLPAPPPPSNAIIIDHNSIALFEQIPDNYIQAAANISMLFRHASVGYNISYGLDCLMNKVQPRPPGCYGDYDPKYNRDNWIFEFHQPPPSQNPGWWEKVDLFIERVDNLSPSENYRVVGYKHGYVDAPEPPGPHRIDWYFWESDDSYPGIAELEALEARHPDKRFMYWTMSIHAFATPVSASFNQQMRIYARTHNKILLDIADITSHRADGTQCLASNGNEAPCPEYSRDGGHLVEEGTYRMAKAVWVLMARLAGWNPPLR